MPNPPKPEDLRLDQGITVLFTKRQKAQILRRAAQLGFRKGEYIRNLVLRDLPDKE